MIFDEIKYIILLKISHPGVSLIPFIAIEYNKKLYKQINSFIQMKKLFFFARKKAQTHHDEYQRKVKDVPWQKSKIK